MTKKHCRQGTGVGTIGRAAKRAVEIAIDQDEAVALNFIRQEGQP